MYGGLEKVYVYTMPGVCGVKTMTARQMCLAVNVIYNLYNATEKQTETFKRRNIKL